MVVADLRSVIFATSQDTLHLIVRKGKDIFSPASE
jgi:hypothetical protein